MKDVEFASMIAEKAPEVGKATKKNMKKDIRSFVEKYPETKYYTLMGQPKNGKENRYVTLFVMSKDTNKSIKELQSFLVDENEQYLGALKGYMVCDGYIEFWYDKDCYLFFNYQNGVIELGK